MSFLPILNEWPRERVYALYDGVTEADVQAALSRDVRTVRDLAVLLSPAAKPFLETMAREAQRLTRRQFGRTISLFAPIYFSNICQSDCMYCGFASGSGNQERRVTLTPEEIEQECIALKAMGYENILLLTGESPHIVPPEKMGDAIEIARRHFAGVSVEVYSLRQDEYAYLCSRGLEGVTMFQETFDRETYSRVHLRGIKKDFEYRVDTLERAGMAGVRKLGMGVLLGLYDWRVDLIWLAMQARHLQHQCWRSAVSISFPRLRHAPTRFTIQHAMNDAQLVQAMLAMRLFLPEVGFSLSTREPAGLRDRLIPLGITSMSAGSSTRPGGYACQDNAVLEQFAVDDSRSAAEVVSVIRKAGYDPVWKDFDPAFIA